VARGEAEEAARPEGGGHREAGAVLLDAVDAAVADFAAAEEAAREVEDAAGSVAAGEAVRPSFAILVACRPGGRHYYSGESGAGRGSNLPLRCKPCRGWALNLPLRWACYMRLARALVKSGEDAASARQHGFSHQTESSLV